MDDAAVREQARIKAAERDAREAEAHAKLKAAERAAQQKEMEVTKQKVASLAVQTDWLENEARIGRLSPTNATLSETETVVARIAQSPTVNDAIKHDADALTRRLKTLHDNAMRLASEHEAMGIVVASATSVTNLREALLAYTQKNPDSSHTSEFARAAANAPKWESVEEAAKLIATWEGKLQPQQSVFIKRSDAMTAYSTKYADSPFAATFDDYRSYLTVAQHALAIEGPWKTELHTLLDTPIFKEMRVLRTTDGKLYYVRADAKVQTNSLGTSFPAITTADVGNVKRVTLKPGLLVSEQPAESAQSKLAAALSKKLTALDETNWETFGLDVIDEILTHNEIDPVLRVMLLSRVARQAQAGTWGAGDVLVALDGLVSALNAGDIAWMNPTDIAANDARPKANAILAGLAPLKEARLLIAGKRAALFKALQFRVAGHGVLIRDGDNWTAGPLKTALAGQEAIIIATDSARPTLVTIGQPGNDGKLMLDPASLHGAPEGEMIFLIDKK